MAKIMTKEQAQKYLANSKVYIGGRKDIQELKDTLNSFDIHPKEDTKVPCPFMFIYRIDGDSENKTVYAFTVWCDEFCSSTYKEIEVEDILDIQINEGLNKS